MIVENLHGTCRVRITDRCVAAGRPQAVGTVLELPMQDAYALVAMGKAELFVAAPVLASLK